MTISNYIAKQIFIIYFNIFKHIRLAQSQLQTTCYTAKLYKRTYTRRGVILHQQTPLIYKFEFFHTCTHDGNANFASQPTSCTYTTGVSFNYCEHEAQNLF